MILGYTPDGTPVELTRDMREQSASHLIGGTRSGKSKLLEWMIQREICEGRGLCLIDWHGTLSDSVLRFCAQLDVGVGNDSRRLILLNPSRPDFVTGFNPFSGQGQDIATQVSRRIEAMIRPWGIRDTNTMPTFERICRTVFTFMIEDRETLPNAGKLLAVEAHDLREYAAQTVTETYAKAQWNELLAIKSDRDWREQVLSTQNRFGRLLGSTGVRRFMSLTDNNLDLMREMNEQSIILVNLGYSDFLPRESAHVFASLLLNEFFEAAMRRATLSEGRRKPRLFTLYLDEFASYAHDLSAMLDQVLKGGLHLVLANQHWGQFAEDVQLRKSLMTNARHRVVFGGIDSEDALVMANELFLPELNTREIKSQIYRTTHLYREETRTITSHTIAGERESESETVTPYSVPVPTRELGSESEWSLEEKRSRLAQMIKELPQRHCFVKLDRAKTQHMVVPFVRDYAFSPEYMKEYEREVYEKQGALPAAEVDRRIAESEQRFLEKARAYAEGAAAEEDDDLFE